MRGHEYVRDEVRFLLQSRVPARLAMQLAALEVDEPDPAEVSFVLADSLQELSPDMLPVVAVRSTDATVDSRAGATVLMVYDLQILVACDVRVFGDEGAQRATRCRDRLLLAVRESLWSVSGLATPEGASDGGIEFLPAKRSERTGRGDPQTLAGLALSVGTVDLRARVTEVLDPLVPFEPVEAVDLGVSGVDASQSV